jgi:hypothetical protein
MGKACSTHGRDEKRVLGIDGKISEWILGWGSVDWVHLAQDRDQWRAIVNTVTCLRVPQKVRNFLTS